MLIIKAYLNEKEIDEILIQNTGEVTLGEYKYFIRKPKIDIPIWCKRGDGYRPLLLKALKIIEKSE